MSPETFSSFAKEFQREFDENPLGVGFWQNRIVQTLLFSALGMLVFSLGGMWFFLGPREALVVLHYNVYFGVDVVGEWWQAYILPAVAVLFSGVHTWLAYRLYLKRERIAAYVLLLGMNMLLGAMIVAEAAIAFINY